MKGLPIELGFLRVAILYVVFLARCRVLIKEHLARKANQRMTWLQGDWKVNAGKELERCQVCHQSMDILEYLHFIVMTVCALWLGGPATEMAQFGVVVAVLIEIHTVQTLARRNELYWCWSCTSSDAFSCKNNIIFKLGKKVCDDI